MSNSRIEQIIEEIEDYIDSCKGPLFGGGDKIVVDRERMEELLRELRMKTPEEIKRYQKILANKDAILADAQQKAEAIIAQANIQNQELVNEHEIMQQAYEQANQVIEMATSQAQEILNNATRDANEIRLGAIQYTDDMLANMQTMLQDVVEKSNSHYSAMMDNFQQPGRTGPGDRRTSTAGNIRSGRRSRPVIHGFKSRSVSDRTLMI